MERELRRLPAQMRLWIAVFALIVLLLWWGLHLWGFDGSPENSYQGVQIGTGFDSGEVERYSTASAVLDSLEVRQAADKTGYARSHFGEAWEDTDHNGCDTRNDVLARDLSGITRDHRCRVLTGVLADPYTTQTVDFVRGQSSSTEVPIDHLVALSNAWQTGATLLSDEERTLLANDPLNLQATSKAANTEKSDSDAAHWLPQAGYRCEYVARQVSVKAAYRLWVTPSEKRAMEQVLYTCPDQPAYRSDYALTY